MASRKSKGRGRPTKLTPAVQRRILKAIEAGCTIEHAAQAAGIHKATLHRWRQQGAEAKTGILRDFCDALEIAEGKAVEKLFGDLQEASSKGNIKSTIFILERRFGYVAPGSKGSSDGDTATTANDDIRAAVEQLQEAGGLKAAIALAESSSGAEQNEQQ